LQGIGMTKNLALPTLIALCSIALSKPVISSMAVLGGISISGIMIKAEELANSLQVCLDSGAKKFCCLSLRQRILAAFRLNW
jgi:ATP-dependent Lon protease